MLKVVRLVAERRSLVVPRERSVVRRESLAVSALRSLSVLVKRSTAVHSRLQRGSKFLWRIFVWPHSVSGGASLDFSH